MLEIWFGGVCPSCGTPPWRGDVGKEMESKGVAGSRRAASWDWPSEAQAWASRLTLYFRAEFATLPIDQQTQSSARYTLSCW
jgi:hypothetical protein